jgi:hypothetical protein
MALSEKALEHLLTGAQGKTQAFAGIEVGAKGVKLSVISIELNSSGEVEYVLKADSSINPEPASLTPQSQIETAAAVRRFIDMAKNNYNIPAEKLYVVVSSGLKTELDKKNKYNDFLAAINPSNMPPGFSIKSVTPQEEGELTVMGTVPPKRRFTTSLLDISSTNTNGGYYMDASQSFDAVYFPVGTRTFVKLVKAKNPANIQEFSRIAEALWRDSLSQVVRDELGRRAGLRNRGYIYLAGGIVWCINSYLHPQKVNDTYSELFPEDVHRFRLQVQNNYEKIISPSLSDITNENLLMDARKNLSRAQNTYDQESLIAGSIWVDGLIKELNATQPVKRFIFAKYSYVGWISGYIARAVTEEYRRKNE